MLDLSGEGVNPPLVLLNLPRFHWFSQKYIADPPLVLPQIEYWNRNRELRLNAVGSKFLQIYGKDNIQHSYARYYEDNNAPESMNNDESKEYNEQVVGVPEDLETVPPAAFNKSTMYKEHEMWRYIIWTYEYLWDSSFSHHAFRETSWRYTESIRQVLVDHEAPTIQYVSISSWSWKIWEVEQLFHFTINTITLCWFLRIAGKFLYIRRSKFSRLYTEDRLTCWLC